MTFLNRLTNEVQPRLEILMLRLLGRFITSLLDRPTARDLDESVFLFWWNGGERTALTRLRQDHPESSIYEIIAAIERGRPLYDSVISFAATRTAWSLPDSDLPSALERQTPGLSRRAYVRAAGQVVRCFRTFEDWM